MQSRGKYLPAVHAIGPSLSSHLPTTYSGNFGAFKTEEQLREKMFPLGLFPFFPFIRDGLFPCESQWVTCFKMRPRHWKAPLQLCVCILIVVADVCPSGGIRSLLAPGRGWFYRVAGRGVAFSPLTGKLLRCVMGGEW